MATNHPVWKALDVQRGKRKGTLPADLILTLPDKDGNLVEVSNDDLLRLASFHMVQALRRDRLIFSRFVCLLKKQKNVVQLGFKGDARVAV